MKPHLQLLALVALVLPAHAGPAPSFGSTHVRLDTLIAGDSATATFHFVNNTAETLLVDDISAPCGCVASASAGTSSAPGDSGAIAVEFHSAGQHGGAREVAVTFRTPADSSRQNTGSVVLSFAAAVEQEVAFIPDVVSGIAHRRGRTLVVPAELVNAGTKAMQVLTLGADAPCLQVLTRQLPLYLERGERLPFVVSVAPGSLPDSARELVAAVNVRTSDTRYRVHRCPVHIFLD
jgi:hypothetical protein